MLYSIFYDGPLVSNNKFYAGVHWKVRNNIKDKYRLVFTSLLNKKDIEPFEKFSLKMRFNSRHDVDNVVATAKIFIDTLKGKWVPDDTKKHFVALTVEHDASLKLNTTVFDIKVLE